MGGKWKIKYYTMIKYILVGIYLSCFNLFKWTYSTVCSLSLSDLNLINCTKWTFVMSLFTQNLNVLYIIIKIYSFVNALKCKT